MPIVHNPSSALAQELRKWEQHPTALAIDEAGEMRPGNPYAYRPYPKMLYRAQKRDNGQVQVIDPTDEAFSKSCQVIVHDEADHRRKRDQGWHDSIAEALAAYEAMERDIARAAAEANFAVQRMSERARAEHQQATDATADHVPDLPTGKHAKRRIKELQEGA